MGNFAEQLHITRGVTAIIGSGGKTTLLYTLARELSRKGSVLVATTTHIWKPEHLPVVSETGRVEGTVCVGTLLDNGKLAAPKQSFAELETLADYVLVEADGSKGLPLKAHAAHEPVIPENVRQVICVVGASGLGRPVREVAHRPEIFTELSESDLASPKAVARVLEREKLHTRVLINQADTPERERLARELADDLSCPVVLAALQKGESLCL